MSRVIYNDGNALDKKIADAARVHFCFGRKFNLLPSTSLRK